MEGTDLPSLWLNKRGLGPSVSPQISPSALLMLLELLVGSQLAARVSFVTHVLAHLACSVPWGWNAVCVCLESRPHPVLHISEYPFCFFGTASAKSLHLPSVLRFTKSRLWNTTEGRGAGRSL